MVMNWGIRPADLIDSDDNRRQFGEEHEPGRPTQDRSSSTPKGQADRIGNGGGNQPLG